MRPPYLLALAVVTSVCSFIIVPGVCGAESEPASPATEAPAEPDPSTLEGVVFTRPEGDFLQVLLEGPKLILRFYDRDLQPVDADVDRALIRVFYPGRDPERRFATRTEDGKALTHGPPLRGPFVFRLYISLFRGENEEAVENYTTNYPKS